VLVLNEPHVRGWRAWTGTTELPVLRANALFRALALPPGDHDVTVEFAPTSWRIGWWLSVTAIGAVVGMVLWPSRRRGPPPGRHARSGAHGGR
jgi:uncharacterized membrane protein YfhO